MGPSRDRKRRTPPLPEGTACRQALAAVRAASLHCRPASGPGPISGHRQVGMRPKAELQTAVFAGRDALSYQPQEAAGDAAQSAHHVRKRQHANQGVEVVFDPAGHK